MNRQEHTQEMLASDHRAESERQHYEQHPKTFLEELGEVARELEETFYEGDLCPQCEKGKLKVSRNNKLYCSEVCWLPKSRHKETLNSALDVDEDLNFDLLNDEEYHFHP